MIDEIQSELLKYVRAKGAVYTELLENGIRFQLGADLWEVTIKQPTIRKNKNRINQCS